MTNENLHNGQAAEPSTGNDAQALPDAAKEAKLDDEGLDQVTGGRRSVTETEAPKPEPMLDPDPSTIPDPSIFPSW